MKIKELKFEINEISSLNSEEIWKNWPVVYVIHNKKEAYIGETTSVYNRMRSHLENKDRVNLTEIKLIADKSFNKSAVLDIESKLIEYMSADQRYTLQNSNSGMRNHNYYQKSKYEQMFIQIWNKLKAKDIVKNDLNILKNSELFKYTPYKNLTDEQYNVVFRLALDLLSAIIERKNITFVINGEAGTGKTVLAMYIMKLIADQKLVDFVVEHDEDLEEKYESVKQIVNNLKIALVVPMTSLRSTLKQVVSKVTGLKANMVIGPSDVLKRDYDLLIVDETHRLKRRVNLTNYSSYDKNNKMLGLEKEGTELDWILLSSKSQIFFYDPTQSIKPTDIRKETFDDLMKANDVIQYTIQSQLRALGGEDYIRYVKNIFSDNPPNNFKTFANYDFVLFNSITDLKKKIYQKEAEKGLSRLVAGYAWKWKTKKQSLTEIMDKGLYDIKIEKETFIWNKTSTRWINSKNAINEVGSIHTTQGYDLNYVGVILGPEIKYDTKHNRIVIDKKHYFDFNGKRAIDDYQELHDYIISIYSVLMTRGIYGTYLYVCDENLRKYLNNYIVSV